MTHTENESKNIAMERLAIALDGGQPLGASPSYLELDLLQTGQLSVERGREVLSHISCNQQYFDQWWRLQQSQRWLEEQLINIAPPSHVQPPATAITSRWSAFVGQLLSLPVAGAMAAVLAVFMVLPAIIGTNSQLALEQQYNAYLEAGFKPSAAPWHGGAITKSLPSESATSVQRRQLRVGIQSGIEKLALQDQAELWTGWLVDLRNGSITGEAGHSGGPELIGEWAVLTYQVCSNDNTKRRKLFLQEQQEILSSLAAEYNKNGESLLSEAINSKMLPCAVAQRVLALGVAPTNPANLLPIPK